MDGSGCSLEKRPERPMMRAPKCCDVKHAYVARPVYVKCKFTHFHGFNLVFRVNPCGKLKLATKINGLALFLVVHMEVKLGTRVYTIVSMTTTKK